ncbi:hypothetical protein [Ruminococcus sp.]|uniref:hypothetical protein n=1 Tax=Ruminococcus sp. TaxID=41978 RepID=UPI00258EB37E|nr:hypothetical protein [Ruminococcus sp.]MCR5020813.1 hypothetical protein [Ruminococcus sp.]
MDSLSAYAVESAYAAQMKNENDMLKRVYPYLSNRIEGQEVLTYAAETHRISDFQALYNYEKVNFMCERYLRNDRAHDVAEDICEAFKTIGHPIKGYEEHMVQKDKEPEFLPGF